MLDPLRLFVLACETGSVTAASRAAHRTQPAVSAALRRLEEDLGARLLDRLPRGVRPTAAGHALLPHARATLASAQACRRAVAEVSGLEAGEVRIGGGAVAVEHLLPPVLARFHARWPRVRLRVKGVFTPRVPHEVRTGALDLGIAEETTPGLVGEPWRHDPLVLVAAPSLPLPAGLRGAPVVTFPRAASLRAAVDRLLPEAEIAVELGSVAAVLGHVRAGLGLALLSRSTAADDLKVGRLIEVPGPRPPERSLLLVHRGVDTLPPAAAALRALLLAPLSAA
jgi:DNA-binding transcriptional LysR family regulator